MFKTEKTVNRLIFAMAAFLVAGLAASLFFNIRHVKEHYLDLAIFSARSVFQSAVEIRRWNADHGGVYVPITEKSQPNPYLKDPRRDVATTDGVKLTKINPAYMTRLISEHMAAQRGIRMHITSLKTIRPLNAPDEWERSALARFETGEKEVHLVKGENVFRYMAPLSVEASCLPCHAAQGYKEGDIRGGISVDIPYSPYHAVIRAHIIELVATHLAFFVLGLVVIAVLGWAISGSVRELSDSLSRVRKLEGILPICSGCKKIRTQGLDPQASASWVPLELYISGKTDASFSHGLCPDCAKRLYPEYSQ